MLCSRTELQPARPRVLSYQTLMSEPAPQVPVSPGDVLLGKYVVERVIGAGGMGVVVAVRHRELNELYAMKFMLPVALANEQAVDRFVREARAAAKLKSEHVAKVHDVGRLENGSPYMVMEHLTGQDLEAVLSAAGPLQPSIAATYVMQACDAIAEAHDAGVIHRDLKPANLFVTKRANGSPCVKVLDFGISKSMADEQMNSMTKTSAIMGSPYYMSPEQMRSSKNVDHRTDVWALGVILYQLSTGRVPFPGETITEVCSGVLADEPPSLTIIPHIPQEFDAIVRRCLQKNPAQRFGNARELAASLTAVAGASPGTSGLNLQIAGAVPGARAPGPAARPATVAMAGPPPALAQELSRSQGGQTQTEWGQAVAQKPKKSSLPLVLGLVGLAIVGGGVGVAVFLSQAKQAPPGAATQANVEPTPASPQTVTPTTDAPATETAKPTDSATTADPSGSATSSATSTLTSTPTGTATSVAAAKTGTKPLASTKPTSVATARPTSVGGQGIF